MKKAVITTGGKQYMVSEGQTLEIELIKNPPKKVSFKPLLIIDDQKVTIGKPLVETGNVEAEVLEASRAADKVTSIRFEAKKRVRKVHGHRQKHTVIKVAKIS